MESSSKNWTVISLGGSTIVPDGVDAVFLKAFIEVIREYAAKGMHFALITGGGKVCRRYQEALKEIAQPSAEDLDWLGIYTTRYNAELVRLSLQDISEPEIFLDPTTVALTGKQVLVGGGWKPGRSSDGSAVALAKTLGAGKLINLSNIDYVYTADPRKDPTATPIKTTSWVDFRKLLPEEWDPGLNVPFDPVAAKAAEEMGLEVCVMNGKNLANLRDYLDGKEFLGTVIH